MKNFVLLLISFSLALVSYAEYQYNVYINSDGVFKKYPQEEWASENLPPLEFRDHTVKPGCINYVSTKLGFLPDEWYVWKTDDNEFFFVFKSFSDDIIYVFAYRDAEILPAETVEDQLRQIGYEYEKHFGWIIREKALKGRIRQSFLEDVLKQKSVGGTLTENRNGYEYHFKDGFLDSYKSLDGLNEKARRYKGTSLYAGVERNAKRKHNLEKDVIKEINFQFACMKMMPDEHSHLAFNQVYDYNFALIWFSIYGVSNKGKLEDFQLIAPDATPIDIAGNKITMTWGSNIFYFENGVLKSVK